MIIPNDANMLLSIINMKLRDGYGSLQELCDDLQLDCAQIEETLSGIGCRYHPEENRFY